MPEILTLLQNRLETEWIIGCNSYHFYQLTQTYLTQFQKLKTQNISPRIIVSQKDHQHFLSAFLAAIITNCHVFLGNHQWQEQEWQQVLDLIQPDILFKADNIATGFNHDYRQTERLPTRNFIMIPTGGTSGKIRFTIHTWETLIASVGGFTQFFELEKVNSFCVLPLYHVSGLMQFVRSFLTGGKLMCFPYSNLKKDILPELDFQDFFISLVPTQLKSLLSINPDFLRQFKIILLGGAPPWNDLLDMARHHQLNLSPTYGMTETASQVVTLKPQDFLQGNQSTGQVLPHAQVQIDDTNQIITIQAKSLFLGYYPKLQKQQSFITDDLGYFDNELYLYVVGRNSQKIITGGENVFPREVENAILATGLVQDVSVIGIPDSQWGEAVTAIYVPKQQSLQLTALQTALQTQLSGIKRPKHWICVNHLPRNQQGKLNYQTLQKIVLTHLNQGNYL